VSADQLDLLEHVEATVDALPTPDGPALWADPVRGHLSVYDAGGVVLTGCDLGDGTLELYAYRPVSLSPALARDLGAALTAWGEAP
jgi:hypothetical protein